MWMNKAEGNKWKQLHQVREIPIARTPITVINLHRLMLPTISWTVIWQCCWDNKNQYANEGLYTFSLYVWHDSFHLIKSSVGSRG